VTALNGVLGYGYDATGNRLSRTSTLAGLAAQTFTYDNNDRISAATFDDNGNTLSEAGQSYGYDFEDRLTSVNSGTVSFLYDGDGNRVARTESGTTVRYLIDELSPTGYPQVAEELTSGMVFRRYAFGYSPISLTQNSGSWTTHYYGLDGGGSVRQLTDATGAITDSYTYDAFGNTIAATGSTVNFHRYRGEWFDVALGLQYLRARWYRPASGRLVTIDAFEGFDSEPISLAQYLYAYANPVGMRDPSGHTSTDTGIILGWDVVPIRKVIATVMGIGVTYACLKHCDFRFEESRGKIQAQGSDFGNPGEGATVKWTLPMPLPRLFGELSLQALWSRLEPKQQRNRMEALSQAWKFIAQSPAIGRPPGKHTFPKDPKRYLKRSACPALDCRIDIDLSAGRSFVFP
jgi:RHS repeat-associated protein